MEQSNDPTVTGERYQAREKDWLLIEALLSGRTALQNEEYLPTHEAEDTDNYEARKKRSFLWPAFETTLRELTGTVFDRPITLEDSTPQPILDFVEDVNGRGDDINRFSRQYFASSVGFGVDFILVEMDKLEAGATAADQIRAKVYWNRVPVQSLLEWHGESVAGKFRFTYVRIRETYSEREGFLVKTKTQVREIDGATWNVWREGENGWEIVETGTNIVGGQPLEFVPLVPFYSGELGNDGNAKPPLMTLAEKNLEHFQKCSDLGNIIRVVCFPMLALSGAITQEVDEDGKTKPFSIGPMRMLHTTDATGKWYFVEAEGGSIEQAEKQIERLEREMKRLAYAPSTEQRSGDAVATVAAINTAKGHSVLESMALGMKDALDLALQYTAMWLNVPAEKAGSVVINTDFAALLGRDVDVDTLVKIRAQRDISRRTLWLEMRRRDVLSSTFDPDDEEGQIESEGEDAFGFEDKDDTDSSEDIDTSKDDNDGAADGTPE